MRTRRRIRAPRGGGGARSGTCSEPDASWTGRHPGSTLIFAVGAPDLCSARRNVVSMDEHLVGRADTCRVFDDALVELDRGRPAALALVGEPGIGKTRLLAELAARAD